MQSIRSRDLIVSGAATLRRLVLERQPHWSVGDNPPKEADAFTASNPLGTAN
jgi:hypothetical protein